MTPILENHSFIAEFIEATRLIDFWFRFKGDLYSCDQDRNDKESYFEISFTDDLSADLHSNIERVCKKNNVKWNLKSVNSNHGEYRVFKITFNDLEIEPEPIKMDVLDLDLSRSMYDVKI